GQVVRAWPVAVQETMEEVVDLDLVGLEHLDLHPVGVAHLGGREAGTSAARDPSSSELTDERGPGIGVGLHGHRDVVEIDAVDQRARTSSKSSRCSRTMRPV